MKRLNKKLMKILVIFILMGGVIYGIDDITLPNKNNPQDTKIIVGMGIASSNIDDNPQSDYISCYAHYTIPYYNYSTYSSDRRRANGRIECAIANNTNNHNYGSWQHTEHYYLGTPSKNIAGLGVTIGDIDADGHKDLVLVGVTGGKLRYRIAKHIHKNGHTDKEYEITVDPDDISYIRGKWSVQGLGASLWDLDHNGKQELLVAWISKGHSVGIEFAILWNLDKNGNYEKITQKTIETLGNNGESGLGIELVQLDDNPAPDLYYTYKIDYSKSYLTRVLYNIDNKGNYKSSSKSHWHRLKTSSSNMGGMGVALSHVDGNFRYDNTVTYINKNNKKIIFDTFMNSLKSTEKIQTVKAKSGIELVKHLGQIVSVIRDEHKTLKYSIMKDSGEWTTPLALNMPNSTEDKSVSKVNSSQAPIQYQYSSNPNEDTPVEIPDGGKFHLISDGEYIYLFYTNGDWNRNHLFVNRYILDKVTNRLVTPYDIRYGRSSQKCEAASTGIDKLNYKDMDGKFFYEPTIEIAYLAQKGIEVEDFSVHIIPTTLPNEERWQLFVLSKHYGRVHTLSFRKAKRDVCDTNGTRVYFENYLSDADKIIHATDKNNKTVEVKLKGLIYHRVDEISSKKFEGLSSTLYSNQQKCEKKMVKRGQRLKLILSNKTKMTEVDYAINGLGELLSIDKSKDAYHDEGCDENVEAYTYMHELWFGSKGKPFIYESADGFLHLIFTQVNYNKFNEIVYDTHYDQWVVSDDAHYKNNLNKISGGVGHWMNDHKRRSPWFYYRADASNGMANVIEYGSYGYDKEGNLKGEIKRLSTYYTYNANGNYKYTLYIHREKVGTLKMRYIGQDMIDSTLIGYIEGAPPVPQENFTEGEDYTDATSVGIVEANSLKQTYVQSKDWGLDFESDGHLTAFAFKVESHYGWLSENSVAYENTETIGMSQSLKGAWNRETHKWEPYNIGTALVKAKKANIYGLYFEDNDDQDDNDRLYAYRTVPIPGSAEEHLTSFVINPNYIKNGNLDSYDKEKELDKTEEQIENKEKHIRAYYKQYKSSAFTSIPELDSISKRNIINEYYWSATGGTRSKSISYSTSMSESVGGSFNFLGMVGVYLGEPFFETAELNILAGAHIEKTFSKTEDSDNAFELTIESNIESKGILDEELNPTTPNKVDYFKWKTAYLEPSDDNFNDFFDKVVDPKWLQKDNVYANRLREARNRSNEVWRIRHFVTFVSRTYEVEK